MSGLPDGAHSRMVAVTAIGLLIELYCCFHRGLPAPLVALRFGLWMQTASQTAARARIEGEKWEAVGFPQGKPLNFQQLTASRFILIIGKRLQNGKRFRGKLFCVFYSLLISVKILEASEIPGVPGRRTVRKPSTWHPTASFTARSGRNSPSKCYWGVEVR